MTMQMLTVMQFAGILGAYLLLVFVLPACVLYKKFKEESFCVRFLIYFTVGNFYVMNIVFLLQLLHISNRVTLILGTALPFFFVLLRIHGVSPIKSVKDFLVNGSKLIQGTMSPRLLFSNILKNIKGLILPQLIRLKDSLFLFFPDWILTILTIAIILWMYGSNMLEVFGYGASDIPVHNYWINAMGENDIFVAGVYPFGFHCVIYYLHTVFNIETFVLLRLFGVIQTLLIHLVLLAFLYVCCKSKYCAYTSVALYVLANVFNPDIFKRYLSSLPQEFGMLFILPSALFLFLFFKERKCEVDKLEKKQKDFFFKNWNSRSSIYLWMFAMNFAMTLIVHFYDTMVAGILCMGIAVGYFFRLFRKRYFWRIMAAGLIGLFVAILPMAVAFIGGKPMQGSLGWGMSVITGSIEDEKKAGEEEEQGTEENAEQNGDGALDTENGEAGVENIEGAADGLIEEQDGASEKSEKSEESEESVKTIEPQKLIEKLVSVFVRKFRTASGYMCEKLEANVYMYGLKQEVGLALFAIVWLDVAVGAWILFRKDYDYGAQVLSCGCGMVFMFVILSARQFGVPAIMDANRSRIYIAYMYPVIIGFAMDMILTLLFGWMKRKWLLHTLSFATIAACMIFLEDYGVIRMPHIMSDAALFQRNEAIICLTNILKENEEKTFTICSANDELRMVEDYGYHYENIVLLRNMEGSKVMNNLVIPTEKVYFFIEKKPIDYTIHYEGSGQLVSEEGAEKPLPKGNGLSIYEGENRWIVMSHMYYWAQEFAKLHEREMKVYYETDNFVCYMLEQNPYRLFDLSIDYGYNEQGLLGSDSSEMTTSEPDN